MEVYMDWICECDSYDEDYNNVVFTASSIYETRVRVVADMVLYPSIQVFIGKIYQEYGQKYEKIDLFI
jgi:acetyltransferase, GNAT family